MSKNFTTSCTRSNRKKKKKLLKLYSQLKSGKCWERLVMWYDPDLTLICVLTIIEFALIIHFLQNLIVGCTIQFYLLERFFKGWPDRKKLCEIYVSNMDSQHGNISTFENRLWRWFCVWLHVLSGSYGSEKVELRLKTMPDKAGHSASKTAEKVYLCCWIYPCQLVTKLLQRLQKEI